MSFTDAWLSWGELFRMSFPDLKIHGLESRFYIQCRGRGCDHEEGVKFTKILLDVLNTDPNAEVDKQSMYGAALSAFQRLNDILATAKDGMAELDDVLKDNEQNTSHLEG